MHKYLVKPFVKPYLKLMKNVRFIYTRIKNMIFSKKKKQKDMAIL